MIVAHYSAIQTSLSSGLGFLSMCAQRIALNPIRCMQCIQPKVVDQVFIIGHYC